MEVQTCAYESHNAYDTDYGKINITSFILCFIIIYSTALSIMLSIIQLMQVIKEEEEEEEEEIIKEVEVEVIKEEDKETKEEDEEEEDEEDEEEILLANYRAKERGLALQEVYKERAYKAVEKWKEAYITMINYNRGSLRKLSCWGNNEDHTKQLKAKFEAPTGYNVDGTTSYSSFKAAINIIYRQEVEDHLVNMEALARAEAVNAFKKIQSHIRFDFAHHCWSEMNEDKYPLHVLEFIMINKGHKDI
jgi:Na+-translocating ferredoxin:NAD+ oxidoreductase RnfG subunit